MGVSEPAGAAEAERERRSFLDRMAERLGVAAGVRSAYGEPVERDGVTVIPVARAAWGFGGGDNAGVARPRRDDGGASSGRAAEGRPSGEGSGGGGGVTVSPVGYVEIAGGRARFRRIWGPGQVALLVGVSGVTAILGMRTLGGLAGRIGRGICGSGAAGL